MRHVIVIGAGIGGLAAALAMARGGASVTVLERADAIREVGAGIQISPNGAAVLDALDLTPRIDRTAPRARAVRLWDGPSGRPVLTLDMARHAPDLAYRFVHRADLIEALAVAASGAGVTIRTGCAAQGVTPGARPCVSLSDGTRIDADLVVGADGIHSVVRPVLNGADAPRFTGQVAWRAVVPNAMDHPAEAWVHMGPGRHLVSYPLRGGTALNLVAVEERSTWADEGWQHADSPDAVRVAFAGFGGAVPAMLQGLGPVGLWGLFRHPVAARWHGPGVALLGDAAHPTLPFLAQGANMALEDAWVLADRVLQADRVDAGLALYQAARRARVVRVIDTASGNAWKYHLRAPLVRGAAHLALRMAGSMAPARMLGGFDWLYRHDVTRPA